LATYISGTGSLTYEEYEEYLRRFRRCGEMSSGMSLHLAGDGEREVADYFRSLLPWSRLQAAVERPLCWTTVG